MARASDFRRYFGVEPAPAWCIEGKIIGHVAERGGELVAVGLVSWDQYGRAWGWYSVRERVPEIIIFRQARAMLALLRSVKEPALYVFSDPRVPQAEKWLRRLGFRPAPGIVEPKVEAWKCDLTS